MGRLFLLWTAHAPGSVSISIFSDFNITAFAGIFQCVQQRDVISSSIFSTHIDTFSHQPQQTGLNYGGSISIGRHFVCTMWLLDEFSYRFFHIPTQFPFIPLNNIYSDIIQNGLHLRSAEFTKKWSYNATFLIRLHGKYRDKLTLSWSSIYRVNTKTLLHFK
jgi:hypothetical protein